MTLIDRGVCSAVVYDTPTALAGRRRLNRPLASAAEHLGTTPAPRRDGCGRHALAEMARPVSRGLYITRFWYVRDVHPLRTVITGMTREGTFLIENGDHHAPRQGSPVHAEHRRGACQCPPGEPRAAPRARRRRIRGTVTLVAHRSLQLHILDITGKASHGTRSPLIGSRFECCTRRDFPPTSPATARISMRSRARAERRWESAASLSEPRLRELFDLCDGLCLPGGPDVEPKLLRRGDTRRLRRRGGQRARPRRVACLRDGRSRRTSRCSRSAGARRCSTSRWVGRSGRTSGTQGATEHNHSQDGSRQELTHNIDVAIGLHGCTPSPVHQLVDVNSMHHQALRDIGRDLVVTARAHDGLVEAVEHPGRRFVVGLQCHPGGAVPRA